MDPLVTVCLITYNHKQFIRQAIEGVLNQQVDFPFELLIADDYSTDGTRDILVEFQQKQPDLVKLILQEKNVGPAQNWMDLITKPKSKYIAYFEGDDYWIDEYKLQKQVTILEQNPECVICYHRVNEEYSGGLVKPETLNINTDPARYSLTDLATGNKMHTPSVVFRNVLPSLPEWIQESPVGDYPLYMLLARHGKIYYLPEVMAVYRKHTGGNWSTLDNVTSTFRWIKVLQLLIREFDNDSTIQEVLQKQQFRYIKHLYENHRTVYDSEFTGQSKFWADHCFQLQEQTIRMCNNAIDLSNKVTAKNLLRALYLKAKKRIGL